MDSWVKQHKKHDFLLYLLNSHSFDFVSDGKTYDCEQEASRALSKNTRRAKEVLDAGEAWIRWIALVPNLDLLNQLHL